MKCLSSAVLSVAFFAVLLTTDLWAETGMCLVVKCASFDGTGEIYRIDFKDDKTVATSGVLGTGIYPRFNPAGDAFAFLSGTKVTVCEIDGTVKKTFTVLETGKLTWTKSGINIGSKGEIRRYSPETGAVLWEQAFENCDGAQVSQNETIATSAAKDKITWRVILHTIATGASKIHDSAEQGCSGCPSPSGTYFTQNMGDGDATCHLQMRIRKADCSKYLHLNIATVTSLNLTDKWCWNRQTWSGNSDSWIVLPVGQTNKSTGCRQIDKNCSPWIYNITTQKAHKLGTQTTGIWQPYDYYSGKIFNASTVVLRLDKSAVETSVDQGNANPANITVQANTVSGSLQGVTIEESAPWLTVTASATSGAIVTLTNSFSTTGLVANAYTANVVVKSTNGGQQTYTVKLTVKTTKVFTSIQLTPKKAVVLNGGKEKFRAVALDQYGKPVNPQPALTWSTPDGGGTIANGIFTPQSSAGIFSIKVTSGQISASATAKIVSAHIYHNKINCGDNVQSVDGWIDDDYFVSKPNSFVTNSVATDIANVVNAAPVKVYKSMNHQDHTYKIPLKTGTYLVRMHLADGTGGRSMTFKIEDSTVLDDFDIVKEAGGTNKALAIDFSADVTDGVLTIEALGNGNDVLVGGLEIFGYEVEVDPLKLTSPISGESYKVGETITITWDADETKVTSVSIYITFNDGLNYFKINSDESIKTGTSQWKKFSYVIPALQNQNSTVSQSCRIMIENYNDLSMNAESELFAIGDKSPIAKSHSQYLRSTTVLLTSAYNGYALVTPEHLEHDIKIFDLKGVCVKHFVGKSSFSYPVTSSVLPQGTYLVNARAGNTTLKKSIILSR